MSLVTESMSREESTPKTELRPASSPSQPAVAMVEEIVHLFKLLADETRVRILYYLQQTDELNVRELCQLLEQRQPSVSHHLALLRVAGLIEMRRDGKHNFYRLVSTRLQQFITTFAGSESGQPARLCFEGFEIRYSPVAERL